MATIKISDITLAGADLFFDSESFLNELSNDELVYVQGGLVERHGGGGFHSFISIAC